MASGGETMRLARRGMTLCTRRDGIIAENISFFVLKSLITGGLTEARQQWQRLQERTKLRHSAFWLVWKAGTKSGLVKENAIKITEG